MMEAAAQFPKRFAARVELGQGPAAVKIDHYRAAFKHRKAVQENIIWASAFGIQAIIMNRPVMQLLAVLVKQAHAVESLVAWRHACDQPKPARHAVRIDHVPHRS